MFYRTWLEGLKMLPGEDFKSAVIAMANLALYDQEPKEPLTGVSAVVYAMAEVQLKANAKRYDYTRRGGAPKGNQNAKKTTKTTTVELKKQLQLNKKNNYSSINKTTIVELKDEKESNKEKEEKDTYTNTDTINIEKEKKTLTCLQKKETNEDKNRATANALCTTNTQRTMTKRKEKFMQEVAEFKSKYPAEMLTEFYNYWTEPNKSKTKMRFELQPTWALNLRLATWARNQKMNNISTTQNRINDYANSINKDMAEYLAGKL